METDFLDDFYAIGMGLTLPSTINKSNPSDNKKDDTDRFLGISHYKKVIEDKQNPIVIRFEGDELVSPDPVNNNLLSNESNKVYYYNNLDVEDDFLIEEDVKNTIIDYYKKSANLLKTIKLNMRKLKNIAYIDTNLLKSMDYKLQTEVFTMESRYIYKEAKLYNLFTVFSNLTKVLNKLNPNEVDCFINTILSLNIELKRFVNNKHNEITSNYDVLEYLLKNKKEMSRLITKDLGLIQPGWFRLSKKILVQDVLDKSSVIGDFINSLYNIENFNINDVSSTSSKYIHYMKTIRLNKINFNRISTSLAFVYEYINQFMKIILDITSDLSIIIEKLQVNESLLFIIDSKYKNSLVYDIELKDPWISSDYYLLKEYFSGNLSNTENIIKIHNHYVKSDDLFIFLGDLTEKEYFTTQYNDDIIELLIKYVTQLNGRKIIVKGDNDLPINNELLYRMGFIEIFDNPLMYKKHILSHEPIANTHGLLNIHGHLYDEATPYWGMTSDNRIKSCHNIYGKIMKLSQLDEAYSSGKYTKRYISELNRTVEERSKLKPIKMY